MDERNAEPASRPTRTAAERRRRAKSQAKKRNTRIARLAENLVWLLVAAVVGVPMLAAALYLMSR